MSRIISPPREFKWSPKHFVTTLLSPNVRFLFFEFFIKVLVISYFQNYFQLVSLYFSVKLKKVKVHSFSSIHAVIYFRFHLLSRFAQINSVNFIHYQTILSKPLPTADMFLRVLSFFQIQNTTRLSQDNDSFNFDHYLNSANC